MQRILKYFIPSLVFFGFHFSFRMFYAFAPLHLQSLGLTQSAIGTLIAVYPFSFIVLSVPIGMFSDRFSPRTSAIAGMIIAGASVCSLQWSRDFWTLFLSFSGLGIGATLYVISAASLYFKSLGSARRGVKLALATSLSALGYGLGPMAGSLILGRSGGMYTLFLTAAAIFLPFALLMRATADVQVQRVSIKDYLNDLSDRRAWFLYFVIFVFSLHFGVENVCYSLFLKYNCGVPETRIGLVFLFVGLTIVPSAFATGLMADSARRSDGLLALGMAISGLFNAAVFFVDSLWTVIPIRVLHAIGDGIFLLYLDIAVNRLFPARRVGAPVGLSAMMRMSGMMCGSLLAGALHRYDLPFLVVGIISVAMAPIVYKYFRSM